MLVPCRARYSPGACPCAINCASHALYTWLPRSPASMCRCQRQGTTANTEQPKTSHVLSRKSRKPAAAALPCSVVSDPTSRVSSKRGYRSRHSTISVHPDLALLLPFRPVAVSRQPSENSHIAADSKGCSQTHALVTEGSLVLRSLDPSGLLGHGVASFQQLCNSNDPRSDDSCFHFRIGLAYLRQYSRGSLLAIHRHRFRHLELGGHLGRQRHQRRLLRSWHHLRERQLHRSGLPPDFQHPHRQRHQSGFCRRDLFERRHAPESHCYPHGDQPRQHWHPEVHTSRHRQQI